MLADSSALVGIRPGVIVLKDPDGKPCETLIWETGGNVDVTYRTVAGKWLLSTAAKEPPIC